MVAIPGPGATPPLPVCSARTGWWLVPLWAGVGAFHMFGPRQDPTLETQSLCPKDCSLSHSGSLGGAGGAGAAGGALESQAWPDERSRGHQQEVARREPQGVGDLVSSCLFLSSSQPVESLSLFFSVSG